MGMDEQIRLSTHMFSKDPIDLSSKRTSWPAKLLITHTRNGSS